MVNNYSQHMVCSKETKDLIMQRCVNEFLRTNPDFKNIKISQNFILHRIAKYYIGEKYDV